MPQTHSISLFRGVRILVLKIAFSVRCLEIKKRLISDVDTYSFCIDIIFGRSLGDIRLYVPLTFLSSCCHEARILKGIVASPRLIEPLIGLFCVLAEGSSQLHWKSQWLSYCDHRYRAGIFQIIVLK